MIKIGLVVVVYGGFIMVGVMLNVDLVLDILVKVVQIVVKNKQDGLVYIVQYLVIMIDWISDEVVDMVGVKQVGVFVVFNDGNGV